MKFFLFPSILLLNAFLSFGYSQCEISNILLYNIECDDSDQFTVELDFEYQNVGNEGFQVIGNGNLYGNFDYENLPITLYNDGNCFTDYEFIVRDNENLSCNSSIELGEICCAEECNLEINSIDFTECVDGFNDITVNLDLQFYYNNFVLVSTNAGDSIIAELQGSSITIENYESGSAQVIEFIISNPDGSCSDSYLYENNCVCHISNVSATVIDCDPESMDYFVQFDFDHNMSSDSFLLGGNNVFSGSFGYNELPVTVGPYSFNDDVSVNYLIQDSESIFCFDGVILGIIDDCSIACNIEIENIVIGECNGDTRDVIFEVENIHVGDLGFEATIDGENFVAYAYGEESYTITVPSTCGESIDLTVSDVTNADCTDTYTISEGLCCECYIYDFDYTIDCNDRTLTFSFFSQNVSENYHIVMLSDDVILYEGINMYGGEPHTISFEGWNVGEIEVTITDVENEDCLLTEEVNIGCNGTQCIDNVEVEIRDCSDDSFTARLRFEHTIEEGSFDLRGNGNEYGTYIYGEDYYDIEGLTSDCTIIYEFVVIDSQDESCQNYVELDDPVCCRTCIDNLSIEYLGCNTLGNMEVVIDFDYSFNDNAYFKLSIDGEEDSYLFADLPLTLSLDPGDHDMVIIADYCIRESNLTIECNNCSVTNIQYEIIDCDDNLAYIKMYGDFDLGTSFSLSLNGEVKGSYTNDDTIYIDNLDYNNINQFRFASEEYAACLIEYTIEPFLCDVAVVDNELSDLIIFQRDNFLYIKGHVLPKKIKIYNIRGTLVSQLDNYPKKIDLRHIIPGIYVVELRTEKSYSMRKIWLH